MHVYSKAFERTTENSIKVCLQAALFNSAMKQPETRQSHLLLLCLNLFNVIKTSITHSRMATCYIQQKFSGSTTDGSFTTLFRTRS